MGTVVNAVAIDAALTLGAASRRTIRGITGSPTLDAMSHARAGHAFRAAANHTVGNAGSGLFTDIGTAAIGVLDAVHQTNRVSFSHHEALASCGAASRLTIPDGAVATGKVGSGKAVGVLASRAISVRFTRGAHASG